MTTGTRQRLPVITRRPSKRLGEGVLTFMQRASVDFALAERQHEAYRSAITSAGGAVIDLDVDDDYPDSTFVEDVLLALPECFVLCRPGAPTRIDEPALIASHLPNDRPVVSMSEPATIDGGDVLRIGRTLFVGQSTRTNAEAVQALRLALKPFAYEVVPVLVRGSLHLKTAVTAPLDDLIVANPDWVDLDPFGPKRSVMVASGEPFAGNTLRVRDALFVQPGHDRTARRLEQAGLRVTALDISEFAKVEAGLTCLSVLLPAVPER